MNLRAMSLVAVFLVVALLNAQSSTAWTQGQAWGYKWELNWKDMDEHLSSNVSFNGIVDGKMVFAYFVKYLGEENGSYRFHFEGSYYVYGYLKGEERYKGHDSEETDYANIQIRKMWINYEGYYELVKVKKNDMMWSNSYYGMKNISYHVYTREPMDIFENLTSEGNNGNVTFRIYDERKLTGNIDMHVNADFDEPIPYLPDGNTTNTSVDTSAIYTVEWNIDAKGYRKNVMRMGGPGASQFNGYGNNSIYIDLSKKEKNKFSGSDEVLGMLLVHGKNVRRTGIVENIPLQIIRLFYSQYHFDMYFYNTVNWGQNATYNHNFYSAVNLTGWLISPFTYILIHGTSTPATESEVKTIESDAPKVYGGYNEYSSGFLAPMVIYTIIAVAVVVAIAVVVMIRIRKK